ncbi:MAG: CheR family methyltransferase [Myxococcota bacterium]
MALDPALFALLTDRVAARAGLRIPAGQKWLLESRVQARLAARDQGETVDAYASLVLRDNEELDRLVETLRVGETFFYRHPRQLRAIRRVALPEIAARCEAEGRPMRIWSAGCASGEEAYSLAMLVRNAKPDLAFEILATDLSEAALTHARTATYDAERLANVPPEIREWALVDRGDRCEVSKELCAHVRFERRNLLRDAYPRDQDLVLCRNVLIYFDAEAKQRVLDGLFAAVRLSGWVALGYADRVESHDGLEALRTDEGVLYRRVGPASVRPPPAAPAEATPAPWPKRPAATGPLRLTGNLSGARGRKTAHDVIAALLEGRGTDLDLRELRFADEGVARELARGAQALQEDGRTLVLWVSSVGIERFLRRGGVCPPARVRRLSC